MHCRVCGNLLKGSVKTADCCGRPSCEWALHHKAQLGETEFRRHTVEANAARTRKEARDDLLARQHSEDVAVWQQAIAQSCYETSDFPLTAIPSGKPTIGAVSTNRRERFKTHLETVIAESFAQFTDSKGLSRPRQAEDPPEDCSVVQQFCDLCRGGCCSAGAETAYLKSETITKYRRQNTGKGQSEVLEDYVSRVPAKAVVGSCIMHGETGCTLPRSMRSYTCNQYLCPGVKSWLDRRTTTPKPKGTFVIQRQLDNLTWPSESQDNGIIATHLVFDP